MEASRRSPSFLHTPIDSVDLTSRNKFRWEWLLLKDNNDEFFSNFIRKIAKDGFAWCCYCKAEIKYGNSGVRALKDHANKSKAHEKKRNMFKTNQSLPAAMQIACSKIAGTATAGSSQASSLSSRSSSAGPSANSTLALPYSAVPM